MAVWQTRRRRRLSASLPHPQTQSESKMQQLIAREGTQVQSEVEQCEAAAVAIRTPFGFGGGSSGSLHSSSSSLQRRSPFVLCNAKDAMSSAQMLHLRLTKSVPTPLAHVEYTKYNTNCGVEHHVLGAPKIQNNKIKKKYYKRMKITITMVLRLEDRPRASWAN